MCLCWCVLLKGLPSCKVSVLKQSLKARRGCHRIINTCSLYNILHSRIRCANQAHLHSFPQISAWNVRCYQSVEALEFSFHSVWVTEACAKPLSWSAWFFFSVHVKYLHAFLQTHAEWSQQIHSCASKWLKENEGRAWFCQSVFQMLLYLHARRQNAQLVIRIHQRQQYKVFKIYGYNYTTICKHYTL